MAKFTDEQFKAAVDSLEEALDALHEQDENNPVLTRPDWSRSGVNLWIVLSNLRIAYPIEESTFFADKRKSEASKQNE